MKLCKFITEQTQLNRTITANATTGNFTDVYYYAKWEINSKFNCHPWPIVLRTGAFNVGLYHTTRVFENARDGWIMHDPWFAAGPQSKNREWNGRPWQGNETLRTAIDVNDRADLAELLLRSSVR